MNKEEIYAAWAPDGSVWSPWAKPVLFAHMELPVSENPAPGPAPETAWAPAANACVAIVVDLPGDSGARLGVALAAQGYRPVPLYNALPLPCSYPAVDSLTGRPFAAVDVVPIMMALQKGAGVLAALNLPFAAPPVFLLDASRHGTGRMLEPGEFDNRSISFTTDFPSAIFLAANGIKQVLLVQSSGSQPQSDLAHSLCRWQDAGLTLQSLQLNFPGPPETLKIPRPTWYRAMFQRAVAALGLRRAATGGFGGWIPDVDSPGGG